MKKVWFLSTCILFSVSVNAAESGAASSAFFHQADGGKFEFTGGLGLEPQKTEWTNFDPNGVGFLSGTERNSNVKLTLTEIPVAVSGEYGINSMLAIGMNLIYGSGAGSISPCTAGPGTNCNPKLTGFFNPTLYLKGHSGMGPGNLIFGTVLDLNVEKAKTNSSGDSNNASGGSTLTPYVGYEMPAGPGFWGARFQYDIWKSDTKSHNDSNIPATDTVQTGGNEWGLDTFYEFNLGTSTLGGNLFYLAMPETKAATNGGAAVGDSDARHFWGWQWYASLPVSNWTLLPNLTYTIESYTQSTSTTDHANILQIGFAGRTSF